MEVESSNLRMLSGDDSGLIVLWACLPRALPRTKESAFSSGAPVSRAASDVDRLLCPLLMLSTGQIREVYNPLGQTRLPEWIKLEVGGIDATKFEDRYDTDKTAADLDDECAAA